MSLIGIAAKAGVTSGSLADLIQGNVPVGIATQLSSTTSSIQEFVNGGTSIGLAARIGCTSDTLQELRNLIGGQGAIGFLIGLCIGCTRAGED